MPGFCEVAAVYIVVAVYRTYLNQWLQIRWRRWLTGRFLDEWLADRAYYRISLTTDRAAIGTDNPDQRIAEDLRDFVDSTLSLGLGLLSNIVSLFSFVGILWGLSGALTLFGVTIPGYMVWVALVYAAIGTSLTHLVGRPLVGAELPPAAGRGGFPLRPRAPAREHGGRRAYGGEAEEKGNLAHALLARDRQLVGDHAADQAAELADRRLRAGRRRVPDHRRRAALLRRPAPARRPDADGRRLRPGAGFALLVRRRRTPRWPAGAPPSSV